MAHHMYTTRGFVLESSDAGESSKTLSFFTEDLGRIRARVQNMRSVSSKLRFSLQNYSLVRVSLVKGKALWRVTSAELIEAPIFSFDAVRQRVFVESLKLVSKLLPPEEREEKIFNLLMGGYGFLNKVSEPNVLMCETILIYRLLYELGYGSVDEKFKGLVSDEWSEELCESLKSQQKEIVRRINEGLEHTGLI